MRVAVDNVPVARIDLCSCNVRPPRVPVGAKDAHVPDRSKRTHTHICRQILDFHRCAERVHHPARRVPQLAERREAAEQAKRRIGAEHHLAAARGHDEVVRLVSAAKREPCLHRDHLRRTSLRRVEAELEAPESIRGPDGREVIFATAEYEAVELVAEVEGEGEPCGVVEVLAGVGDRDVNWQRRGRGAERQNLFGDCVAWAIARAPPLGRSRWRKKAR